MALKQNTWKLNQWYDQDVAGNVSYSGANYMFAWGQNNFGQAAQNNKTAYSSPVQVPGSWSALGRYSGNDSGAFTGGVKTDGTLWSWGYNKQGQLGQNSQTYYSSPVQIPGTTWVSLFIGGPNVAFATRTDGTLWAWGFDEWGVLGQNARSLEISSPVQIPGTTWGSKFTTDNGSAMAIRTDGTLWSWGYNGRGQLGLNDRNKRSSPVQVGSDTTWSVISGGGGQTSAAIRTDGTLWVWGNGATGALGVNANAHKSSPTQVGSDTTWSKISSGHSMQGAIKTDGTLWTWGDNTNGKLGLNASVNAHKSSPTQVGSDTTWSDVIMDERAGMFAIKTDNTLWAWGYGNFGTLGQNESGTMRRSSPVQVPGTTWAKFSGVGAASAIAIKNV